MLTTLDTSLREERGQGWKVTRTSFCAAKDANLCTHQLPMLPLNDPAPPNPQRRVVTLDTFLRE